MCLYIAKKGCIIIYMRKKISIILKILIIACAFCGVTVGMIFYESDGYSFWYKKLMYFTTQSNLWIAFYSIIYFVLLIIRKRKGLQGMPKWYYLVHFVLTVSITLTGVVFCSILGPFAKDDFNAWSASSLLVHVFVPVFAIADFFVAESDFVLTKKHLWFAIIPPLYYMLYTVVMYLFGIDFGRGVLYSYFFLDYASPAGFFGFAKADTIYVGTIYWVIFMLGFIMLLAYIYYILHPNTKKARKKAKGNREDV